MLDHCFDGVSIGIHNTKIVYKVLNLSVAKCTKGHIRISVITDPYCYLWSCKSKGCQVVEFVILVYSEKIHIWKTVIMLRSDSQIK
jgi:hypothetical protein